ncbi:MAG: FAD-dependent oxidoreductase [Hyphomicrobiaceae bacterium]
MTQQHITIIGAGITGLWQATVLASAGHVVRVLRPAKMEKRPASWYAGGMLAPFCESEAAERIVGELGRRSIDLWRDTYTDVTVRGSLVIAGARDRTELQRFARMTDGHVGQGEEQIGDLEPELAGRFGQGLYYREEAHLSPRDALAFLETHAAQSGVTFADVTPVPDGGEIEADGEADWVIDCRGLGARGELTDLRGVRGEMAVLRTDEVHLSRPIRLLHPRFPLYVVPWGDGRFMVGATVIEREDDGPVTVRSALELLGHAYALHPGFGEAEVEEFGAGVRPAFADNAPRIVVRGRRLYINGMYRHGFLTAPALAELVATYLKTGAMHPEVFVADRRERNAPGDGCPDAA